jgi:hypothetical protein
MAVLVLVGGRRNSCDDCDTSDKECKNPEIEHIEQSIEWRTSKERLRLWEV